MPGTEPVVDEEDPRHRADGPDDAPGVRFSTRPGPASMGTLHGEARPVLVGLGSVLGSLAPDLVGHDHVRGRANEDLFGHGPSPATDRSRLVGVTQVAGRQAKARSETDKTRVAPTTPRPVTPDDPDAIQTVLVETNHDVAQATEDQEVINPVKDMKSQVLSQHNQSRFTRYEETPI